jgi:hypothetical protein
MLKYFWVSTEIRQVLILHNVVWLMFKFKLSNFIILFNTKRKFMKVLLKKTKKLN